MTRDQIIQHINTSIQHYYSREQVIAILNKLTKIDKPLNPALRKAAVISSCDCLVGFLSGVKVSKSDIDYEVKRISDIQPKFKEYGLLNGEPLSPKQIVDNRRGYLSRFAYCPYCGEKINWKQVVSNCL
jgi:hypothetical protein